jgi:hypothetical protein
MFYTQATTAKPNAPSETSLTSPIVHISVHEDGRRLHVRLPLSWPFRASVEPDCFSAESINVLQSQVSGLSVNVREKLAIL